MHPKLISNLIKKPHPYHHKWKGMHLLIIHGISDHHRCYRKQIPKNIGIGNLHACMYIGFEAKQQEIEPALVGLCGDM